MSEWLCGSLVLTRRSMTSVVEMCVVGLEGSGVTAVCQRLLTNMFAPGAALSNHDSIAFFTVDTALIEVQTASKTTATSRPTTSPSTSPSTASC